MEKYTYYFALIRDSLYSPSQNHFILFFFIFFPSFPTFSYSSSCVYEDKKKTEKKQYLFKRVGAQEGKSVFLFPFWGIFLLFFIWHQWKLSSEGKIKRKSIFSESFVFFPPSLSCFSLFRFYLLLPNF
jgi:hypothetical protein